MRIAHLYISQPHIAIIWLHKSFTNVADADKILDGDSYLIGNNNFFLKLISIPS